MNDWKNRQAALDRLVYWTDPIQDIQKELRKYPWDWPDEPLLIISPEELIHVLEAVIDGDESFDDLEIWADLIEGREDLKFEDKYEELLKQVIHELANPTLFSPLNKTTCQDLLDRISKEF